jgi:transcriptional regulator with XRE-family HTH domain
MGTRAVDKGAVSDAVADNVRAIRERRGLSQAELAQRLSDLGRPMVATAIAKIEGRSRRVDVDDLVALATALNVMPARLLLPDVDDMDLEVALTPEKTVPAWAAWQWVSGEYALDVTLDTQGPEAQRLQLEYTDERPVWLRSSESHPLYLAVRHLTWTIRRTLQAQEESRSEKVRRHAVGAWASKARQAVQQVSGQLDELTEGSRGER